MPKKLIETLPVAFVFVLLAWVIIRPIVSTPEEDACVMMNCDGRDPVAITKTRWFVKIPVALLQSTPMAVEVLIVVLGMLQKPTTMLAMLVPPPTIRLDELAVPCVSMLPVKLVTVAMPPSINVPARASDWLVDDA